METTLTLTEQELNLLAAGFGELQLPVKHTAQLILPLLKKLEDAAENLKKEECQDG
jgi:hypothetical protein